MSGRIFKSTLVTGSATLVSRITGLAREIVYAVAFGASAFMDAWLVAFKIPNFLRRLFAEGSFSQAFVPVISEYKVKRPHDEVPDEDRRAEGDSDDVQRETDALPAGARRGRQPVHGPDDHGDAAQHPDDAVHADPRGERPVGVEGVDDAGQE